MNAMTPKRDVAWMFVQALVYEPSFRKRLRLSLAYNHWRQTGQVSSATMDELERTVAS